MFPGLVLLHVFQAIDLKSITHDTFFSRMRSEGFPFIVWGLGAGPLFALRASCRRRLVVVGVLIPYHSELHRNVSLWTCPRTLNAL